MVRTLFYTLVTGTLFLVTATNGGPPLQSELPMGFYFSNQTDNVQLDKSQRINHFEDTYRLPLSVQPIHYDLEIRPILDTTGEDQYTAPGKVAIRVKCFETTDSITLHSKTINISHDQITVDGINPVENIGVLNHSEDAERSFYIIHLDRNLTIDTEYIVTIPFISKVATDRLDGLYRSSYQSPDGSTKYLATTQFQKDDASRAFPCFDEPSQAFRATFNVTIGRKAEGFHSLANTERVGEPVPIPGLDGWVWDYHNVTVNMPTYLVAIIVSDFKSETAPEGLYRMPVRTWAAPPLVTSTSAQFSAEAAAKILNYFEQYFDYPYQLSKMDSVAIPDFAAGAMENWGLNTYRINLMIWLEQENTRFEKWRSAAVIAHELVHQWFGNLVTCEWWNDTWLNEGFARYLQFIGANWTGDFRSLDRYVIDVTQVAMAYDEGENTEPVHSNITDRVVDQAARVVYEKAAALIRMMQSFLTEETLIKGLRAYLKRHAYGGVVQDHLFAALTEQAVADDTFTEYTVKEIMDSWTLQSGFPIVHVTRADSKTLYVSQERYSPDPLSRSINNELWYVPISFVTASNPDFSPANTRPKAWINKDTLLQSLTVPSTDEWIIINPDARGFYRVVYDSYLTNLIKNQLETDHTVISFGSRSQLIDDYFRAASAKYVNIQFALDFTRYLSKEDDFIVWTTVVNNLTPLYTRLADTDAVMAFREYIVKLVVDPLQRIGATPTNPLEASDRTILRTQLLDWACSFNHNTCVDAAEKLFADWIPSPPQDDIPVPTDIQPMIYCNAVASSGSNTTVRDFLLQEYVRNKELGIGGIRTRQQSLIVNALACDQTSTNLEMLLNNAIDTSSSNQLNITTHGLQLLQSIGRNMAGRELLWTFVVNKQAEITEIYGPMGIPNIISTIAPYLSSRSINGLQNRVEMFIGEYLTRPDITPGERTSLEASLSTIERNSVWMSFYFNDVKDWLSDQVTSF